MVTARLNTLFPIQARPFQGLLSLEGIFPHNLQRPYGSRAFHSQPLYVFGRPLTVLWPHHFQELSQLCRLPSSEFHVPPTATSASPVQTDTDMPLLMASIHHDSFGLASAMPVSHPTNVYHYFHSSSQLPALPIVSLRTYSNSLSQTGEAHPLTLPSGHKCWTQAEYMTWRVPIESTLWESIGYHVGVY